MRIGLNTLIKKNKENLYNKIMYTFYITEKQVPMKSRSEPYNTYYSIYWNKDYNISSNFPGICGNHKYYNKRFYTIEYIIKHLREIDEECILKFRKSYVVKRTRWGAHHKATEEEYEIL